MQTGFSHAPESVDCVKEKTVHKQKFCPWYVHFNPRIKLQMPSSALAIYFIASVNGKRREREELVSKTFVFCLIVSCWVLLGKWANDS